MRSLPRARGGKGSAPAKTGPVTANKVAADLAVLKVLIALSIAVAYFSH